MVTPFPVRANGSILQYPNGEDDIVQSNVKWLDCGEGAFNSISTYVAGGSPVVFVQKRFRVQYSSLSDADAVTIENFYTSMGGRLGSFSMIDDAGNTWLDCHFDVDQLDVTYEQLNVRSMSFEILAVNPVTLNSMDPTVYLARQFYAPNDGIDFGTSTGFNVQGDLSIGMWVYLIPQSTGTLISYGSDGGTFPAAELAYCLSIAGGPTTFSIKYSHDWSGGRESHTFTANIPVNTWTYVGITRNASAKTVALTTNVGGTMTLNQTITYTNAPGTASPAAVSHLTVGTLATSSRGYIPVDPSLFPTVALIETAYIWNVQETLANHTSAAALTPSTTGLILNLATMGQSPEPSVISVTTTLGFVTGTRRVPGR